jgi:hypothetical protein
MLLRILDALRAEARGTKWDQQYATDSADQDSIQQARGKAFIHLYLKVMFEIADFAERESYVTDGADDGGIDGYYIGVSIYSSQNFATRNATLNRRRSIQKNFL